MTLMPELITYEQKSKECRWEGRKKNTTSPQKENEVYGLNKASKPRMS